jgi:hypothetical protein
MDLSHRTPNQTYFRTSIPNDVWDSLQTLPVNRTEVLAYLRRSLLAAARELSKRPTLLAGHPAERSARHSESRW